MSRGYAPGFDIDVAHGEFREGALAQVLALRYGDRIEVKSDFKCRTTGNLCLEYAQKGRSSGLAATTADWWAFEYYDDCWLIVPTVILRRLARRAWLEGRRRPTGDNGNESVLLPIAWLFSFELLGVAA